MSLEKALEANTTATLALIEQMKSMTAKGATTAKPAAKAAAKPAAKEEAEAPKTTKPKPTGKKKAASKDDLVKVYSSYLKEIEDDDDEIAVRRENVSTICEHFGVAKITLIEEAQYDEAIGHLKAYIDGGTPSFMDEAGAAETGDDEDDSLV